MADIYEPGAVPFRLIGRRGHFSFISKINSIPTALLIDNTFHLILFCFKYFVKQMFVQIQQLSFIFYYFYNKWIVITVEYQTANS